MRYVMTLTDNKGGKISFDPKVTNSANITSVIFGVSQTNENVLDHASQLQSDVIVKGEIEKDTAAVSHLLLEWSLAAESDRIYKTLSIDVYTAADEESLVRHITMEDMFCVSYQETFSETNVDSNNNDNSGGEKGTFIIKMRQRKGRIDKIKTASKK